MSRRISRSLKAWTAPAAFAAVLLGASTLAAHDVRLKPTASQLTRYESDDSTAVALVVERYHQALASGDSATALRLLAPDAVILEGGSVETREHYREHHLPADIGFTREVPAQRGMIRVVVRGDVAWASSTSTSTGSFRGRAINSRGAELMVLSREGTDWVIRAIHWSSGANR